MNEENETILSLNVRPSFNGFLDLLSITTKGLAAQLLDPVYKQFFVYSQDIKEEYVKYYSIEYPTLSEYIEICHNKKLPEEELDKKYIYKVENQCQLTNPAYDTDYFERIIDLLKTLEKPNEN